MTTVTDRLIALFTECCTVAIRDLTAAVEEHTAIEQGLDGTPDPDFGWSAQSEYECESGLRCARGHLARAIALAEAAPAAREEDSGDAWGRAWVSALEGLERLGWPTVHYHEAYDAQFVELLGRPVTGALADTFDALVDLDPEAFDGHAGLRKRPVLSRAPRPQPHMTSMRFLAEAWSPPVPVDATMTMTMTMSFVHRTLRDAITSALADTFDALTELDPELDNLKSGRAAAIAAVARADKSASWDGGLEAAFQALECLGIDTTERREETARARTVYLADLAARLPGSLVQ